MRSKSWFGFFSLFFILALILIFNGCTKKQEEKTASEGQTTQEAATKGESQQVIKIGVLTDLSGGLATIGSQVKGTTLIAKDWVENYLNKNGYPYKIELYVEDTQANPSICLKKVQALQAKGVKLFVGPLSSSEVKNLKNFVTSNKLVIISPSSTAPPTIVGFTSPEEKKYVFRFIPNDQFQGKAIASEIKSAGYKNVVVLYREDAWGQGLKSAAVENLKKLGVHVLDIIGYPSNPEPSDWSPYIEKMENLLSGHSPQDTAVLVITFEEVASLLSQIPESSPLLKYTWFGQDAIADSQKVISEALDKASKVHLYSTLFYGRSEDTKKLVEEFKKRGYGKSVSEYALCAFDSLWVGAISYAEMLKESGKYDPELLVKKIKENAIKYTNGEFGMKPVSGYLALNKWNDRDGGDYGIHAVTPKGWKLVGIWKFKQGKIEWLK